MNRISKEIIKTIFFYSNRKLEPCGVITCLKCVPADLLSATFITCACENIIFFVFFVFYLAPAFRLLFLRPTGVTFCPQNQEPAIFSRLQLQAKYLLYISELQFL